MGASARAWGPGGAPPYFPEMPMFSPTIRRAAMALPCALLLALFWAPNRAFPCACGCGIFETGLPGLPDSAFATQISLQVSYMNQNMNQEGKNLVNSGLNSDKEIETSFINLDIQHQFNQDWGAIVEIPYWMRHFATDVNGSSGVTDQQAGVVPDIRTQDIQTLSDIRVMGMYTGFSGDMSTGLKFGLKLPTGPYDVPLMDRDTAPGTGTTDLLLGGYHMGQVGPFGWFLQGLLDTPLGQPVDGYQPGSELDAALGGYWNGLKALTGLVPMLQLNGALRAHDYGGDDIASGNGNSGYENLFVTPGLMESLGPNWQVMASVYLPVARDVHGDQLVPSWMGNAGVSYMF